MDSSNDGSRVANVDMPDAVRTAPEPFSISEFDISEEDLADARRDRTSPASRDDGPQESPRRGDRPAGAVDRRARLR
jgi:hypothetical protein